MASPAFMSGPDFDVKFAIASMYPLANAAYLAMNVPQPPVALPPGYAVAGIIRADPPNAVHAMSLAHPDQQRIANRVVSESSIFGLVAYNAAQNSAIVALRGTMTIWEWLGDFDSAPVPYLANPLAGFVHMGFQLVYEHICASLEDILKSACPGVKHVFVTGHSLGAAVAILCAYDIAKRICPGIAPDVVTFAGPRVGDPLFVHSVNNALHSCCRIVNFMDVVPQVPAPPLYEHAGQEILVAGGFRPLDVSYAHNLTTYLSGLQKLRQ